MNTADLIWIEEHVVVRIDYHPYRGMDDRGEDMPITLHAEGPWGGGKGATRKIPESRWNSSLVKLMPPTYGLLKLDEYHPECRAALKVLEDRRSGAADRHRKAKLQEELGEIEIRLAATAARRRSPQEETT